VVAPSVPQIAVNEVSHKHSYSGHLRGLLTESKCVTSTYGLVTLHMAHMTRSMMAIKTPSPYRRSLWKSLDGLYMVRGRDGWYSSTVCCTVVTVYGYGGQP
jgi:hypothetical protein